MSRILEKYADLLLNYCLELKPGERLFIRSTFLAEPLLIEIHKLAAQIGAWVEYDLDFAGKNSAFINNAAGDVLDMTSPFGKMAMEEFEAFLFIRAPYNLFESSKLDPVKIGRRKKAGAAVSKTYFSRTATRDLKRSLCQYPTEAAAQNAGMSLEQYQQFVFNACNLFADDPKAEWLKVRKNQQAMVDLLNSRTKIHYKSDKVDISFSTEGRTWINSDGQTNMPSGEVYTSPVENSVNGFIHFDLPTVYMGKDVEGVTLWVKDGYIEKWEAKRGQSLLDEVFQLPGARRFGEAAIGTNYNIKEITKNILFDEKIGGTVHMAIGQSYLQCGGKNESAIHWDMIANMSDGGAIFADGEKIYESGQFLTA